MSEETRENTQSQIHCPMCDSTNWRCYNETSRPCWDKHGNHAGDRVIGGLVCNACGADWLDYSVDPQLDDPDCDCEDYWLLPINESLTLKLLPIKRKKGIPGAAAGRRNCPFLLPDPLDHPP